MDAQDFLTYFAFYINEPWDKKIDVHHNRLLTWLSGSFSKKRVDPVTYFGGESGYDSAETISKKYSAINSMLAAQGFRKIEDAR